ncbi:MULTISPECIES: helix-turn-helix domain-containing protein [Gordonibacter]|uniref:Helix-turn-helix transcriptional regulator n=1 Tax=Gordonibacter faecis TaxID=3047475 RepID=A0ABT7DLT6_9ACTN|nr:MULTISPECIES: helix-turn-helix transcriptional regulator [unclassified Gordonibacter]MDJ1650494.1 helix-turn-helix transcriptional regulator [Gordonibacter sp. KGMB12511]
MTRTTPRKGSFMNVEIAQRLAALRREKGYSQEELAERLGLSRQAVSKWERAESSPDIGNIVALAKLYGVSVDELLRVDENIADLEDDARFEEQDKTAAAEAEVQAAAVRANEAAVRAAQAAVAAAQARATAEQAHAHAQVPPAAPQSAAQPMPQPAQPAPQPQVPPVPQQPYAPYAQPAPQPAVAPERKRGPWLTFPYPILCVIIFLLSGFFTGWWHPAWLIFLTIPLYYWIARIIENDPNYRADHERRG